MLEFKAVVLGREIDLNKTAQHFGINQKFQWEDLLILNETCLARVLNEPEGRSVYVFSFGALVFVNFSELGIVQVVKYIQQIQPEIDINKCFDFADEFTIKISQDKEDVLTNDILSTRLVEPYHGEIIATVLAKSVALERNEVRIDKLLDDAENIVDLLEQGKLNVSDDKLAKIIANIFRYKFNTISYIQMLDKPYITWVNEQAGQLFTRMSALFELDDRYNKIRLKSETLMDITNAFSGLAHSRRGTRLEWAVIVLIGIEIVLSIVISFFGGAH
ncbi:MAG: putative YagE family [Firmicutes bacterium]|nr:putative YagE family [Bacillota bacterium]